MTQPESRIVTSVIAEIRQRGGHAIKTHPAGGTAGTPDVVGALLRRSVAIEVKRPQTRHNVSPRQRHQLARWAAAGAITGVVCSRAEAAALLDAALPESQDPR